MTRSSLNPMLVVGLALCLVLLQPASSWGGSKLIELTKDNVDSQAFKFRFDYSKNWFYAVVTVTIRPKNEQLSEIRDQVGGCMAQCQEALPSFDIQETPVRATEENGALVYHLHVPWWARKRCFYFWRRYEMPGEDIWMVNLGSPLVRSGTPE